MRRPFVTLWGFYLAGRRAIHRRLELPLYRFMLYTQRSLRLSAREREAMRVSGRFNAEVLDYIRPHVKPGISTGELDRMIYEYTVKHGHRPAPLGYPGQKGPYPKCCCTSVNEVICHGIPGPYVLKEGDIVNIDITSVVHGWHGDVSETFPCGEIGFEAKGVMQCAFDCLYLAIDAITPGCRVSEIGEAIVHETHKRGFSVVQEYVGHGVGREFHQKPSIPHVPTADARRERLEPGMCFTIEPMINAGAPETMSNKKDGWTVRTKDGSLSAQFEHTILMTEQGPEILTLTKHGPKRGHQF